MRCIAVAEGNVLKADIPFDLIRKQLNRIFAVLHIDCVIQQFKNPFTRCLGLRVVVDMVANPPHRSDNVPNHTEECNQLTKCQTFLDYLYAAKP
ncbi:hypothetical protein D3C78_1579210 [compost metagenome]